MGGDSRADFVQVEDVHEMHGHTQFGEELVEQGKGRAVDIRRRDDMAPRAASKAIWIAAMPEENA